jgi:hypothetical protein
VFNDKHLRNEENDRPQISLLTGLLNVQYVLALCRFYDVMEPMIKKATKAGEKTNIGS